MMKKLACLSEQIGASVEAVPRLAVLGLGLAASVPALAQSVPSTGFSEDDRIHGCTVDDEHTVDGFRTRDYGAHEAECDAGRVMRSTERMGYDCTSTVNEFYRRHGAGVDQSAFHLMMAQSGERLDYGRDVARALADTDGMDFFCRRADRPMRHNLLVGLRYEPYTTLDSVQNTDYLSGVVIQFPGEGPHRNGAVLLESRVANIVKASCDGDAVSAEDIDYAMAHILAARLTAAQPGQTAQVPWIFNDRACSSLPTWQTELACHALRAEQGYDRPTIREDWIHPDDLYDVAVFDEEFQPLFAEPDYPFSSFWGFHTVPDRPGYSYVSAEDYNFVASVCADSRNARVMASCKAYLAPFGDQSCVWTRDRYPRAEQELGYCLSARPVRSTEPIPEVAANRFVVSLDSPYAVMFRRADWVDVPVADGVQPNPKMNDYVYGIIVEAIEEYAAQNALCASCDVRMASVRYENGSFGRYVFLEFPPGMRIKDGSLMTEELVEYLKGLKAVMDAKKDSTSGLDDFYLRRGLFEYPDHGDPGDSKGGVLFWIE